MNEREVTTGYIHWVMKFYLILIENRLAVYCVNETMSGKISE